MAGFRRIRRVLLLAAIIPAGLLLTLIFHRSPPEPTWKGRPVSAWVKEIRFYNSDGEATAEAAILHLGPPAAPCLITNLKKRDALFSDWWVNVYPKLPAWIRKNVAAPRARWETRADGAKGLELLGPAATQSVPFLIAALDDKKPWVRSGAASALGSMGPAGAAASERLIAALKDPDRNFQLASLMALGRINRSSNGKLDSALVPCLKHPDPNFRANAAEALGRSTGKSPAVAEALTEALRDPSAIVVESAAIALARQPEQASKSMPALLEALSKAQSEATNSGQMIAMWKILGTLAELGPAAGSAVPVLTNLLDSKIPIVGTLSAIAWANIDTNNPAAVECLVNRLNESNSDQFWATWAHGKLGPRAQSVLPRLKAMAAGQIDPAMIADRNLQIMVVAASWRIDPRAPNPTRRILELLGPKLRRNGDYETVRLLGELGPAAQEAVPLLLEGFKSSGGMMLRDYCMDALEKIDPESAHDPWR